MRTLRSIAAITRKILLITLGALTTALIVLAVTHQVLTRLEKRRYPAPGRTVAVDGRTMHVYSEGKSDRRVVLLSGLGTPCPVLDFKPLISALRDDGTVIVVEYLGYGWSDLTDRDRTVANIVGETRAALAEAGFEPPYVLMPHSISGIYALHYANMYPEEVEAVVGIDMTVLSQFRDYEFSRPEYRTDFLRRIGIVRLAIALFPSLAQLPQSDRGEYTEEDLKLIRMVTCWRVFNRTVLNENSLFEANVAALRSFSFPDDLPVLLSVSQQTSSDVEKMKWSKSWLEMQEDAIRNVAYGKAVMLGGGHMLHWNCSQQMAAEMREFLEGY